MSWASLVFLNPELGLEEGRGKAARVFLVRWKLSKPSATMCCVRGAGACGCPAAVRTLRTRRYRCACRRFPATIHGRRQNATGCCLSDNDEVERILIPYQKNVQRIAWLWNSISSLPSCASSAISEFLTDVEPGKKVARKRSSLEARKWNISPGVWRYLTSIWDQISRL